MDQMNNELSGKKKSYIVASHCHSVIQEDDDDLEHIIIVLKDHFQRYKNKMKISYNSCCHLFTTAKFDSDNGEHISRNILSLRYLMEVNTLDKHKMTQFIVENGWSDKKGRILYPGWNMPCNQKYSLHKRLGIESRNEKPN